MGEQLMKRYAVSLTINQCLALVDIDTDYSGPSPRWSLRTLQSLAHKGLIYRLPSRELIKRQRQKNDGRIFGIRLTKKGQAYLQAALTEEKETRELYEQNLRLKSCNAA